MQKITMGMWIGIISASVSLLALAWSIHSSSVATHERMSKIEGKLDQLVMSVNNLEEAALRHDRSIDNNSRRIAYTQDSIEKTQKQIPKLREALEVVKAQVK